MDETQRPQLHALTGVRFFAALWVVLFHYTGYYFGRHLDLPPIAREVTGAGAGGVNLFFLLSGFILAYNYLTPDGRLRGTMRAFYRARFARIYPVYVLGLVAALPFVTWPAHEAVTQVATLGLLQTWLPWWDTWNSVGWTLSVEACFYALFPLLAVHLVRCGRSLLLLAGCWLTLQAVPLIDTLVGQHGTCSYTGNCSSYVVMHLPLLRLPEFAMGVALAGLYRVRPVPPRWLRVAVLPALFAGILTAHLLPYEMVWNGLLDPLYAGLLYVLASSRGILASRPLVRLGEASYALYLLQWAVWDWGQRWQVFPTAPSLLAFSGYLAVLVIISLAVYRYVETPARRALHSWRWLGIRPAGAVQLQHGG